MIQSLQKKSYENQLMQKIMFYTSEKKEKKTKTKNETKDEKNQSDHAIAVQWICNDRIFDWTKRFFKSVNFLTILQRNHVISMKIHSEVIFWKFKMKLWIFENKIAKWSINHFATFEIFFWCYIFFIQIILYLYHIKIMLIDCIFVMMGFLKGRGWKSEKNRLWSDSVFEVVSTKGGLRIPKMV